MGVVLVLILSQIAILSYANPLDDVLYERTRWFTSQCHQAKRTTVHLHPFVDNRGLTTSKVLHWPGYSEREAGAGRTVRLHVQ